MAHSDIVPCKRKDVHPLHHWYTNDMPAGSWHYCPGYPAEQHVLHPGDKLVVVAPKMMVSQADALMDQFEQQLGKGVVFLLCGADNVYIQRGSDDQATDAPEGTQG